MKLSRLSVTAVMTLATLPVMAADQFSGYEVSPEGAWCWFADPRAIHHENSAAGVNASYLGYIDVHGNIRATQYDFNNNGQRSEVLVRSNFQPDDHNNPTFLVLPDQRVLIIYSRHTDEAAFYYRVSKRPGDISDLGEEKKIVTANNTTYPSPFILSDDPEHFYLCWRGIGWHPTIARFTLPDANDDVKNDWGAYQMVQSTGARPYAKYTSNGKDKIYLTYTTGHPDNEQPNWIYYNVVNINATKGADGKVTVNPTLEDIKGNKLSTIANGKFNVNKQSSYKSQYPYTVVDAPSSDRDWVWQTTIGPDGNPVIAMVRINGGKSQHDYYYAKWTGNEWRVTFLANGGGKFHSSNTEYCYSGGMAIDPSNVNDVYMSIPTDGTNGKVFEIWKYTIDASGNVTDKVAVTSNSLKNNVRPYILPDSQNTPLRLGWMNGDYYYWMVQKNYPAGYPTAVKCDYNYTPMVNTANTTAVSSNAYNKAMTASASEKVTLPSKFTLSATMTLSHDNYGGVLISADGFKYGVDKSSVKPYLEVNGTKYVSSNTFYTADDWATTSTGTSGDYHPTKLNEFNITISYDGSVVTIYRNGLIDQKVSVSGLNTANAAVGGFDGNLKSVSVYGAALNQDEIKYTKSSEALAGLSLPEKTYTDLVLPGKVGGVSVEWTSSNPGVISGSGIFTAPAAETSVKLTANADGSVREFTVVAMPRDLKANLLVAYDFETSNFSGNKVKDISGNGRDLTVAGNAKVDGTLNLEGNTANGFSSNGYALLPEGLLNGLRSYTVSFTATPKSLSKAPRFYDFGGSASNSFFCRANTVAAGIKLNGGTTTMTDAGNILNTGTAYNVAVTFDAGSHVTTIYVDGRAVASNTNNVNEPYMITEIVADTRNYIGRTQWWDGSYAADNVDYVGTIDDFKVYNTALTEAEVAELAGVQQEDPSEEVDMTDKLVNPGFESSFAPKQNSGVKDDRAIYVPEGWETVLSTLDENDFSALDSSCLYYNDFFASLPQAPDGGKKTYFVRQRWGLNSAIGLYQTVKNLPPAYYAVGASIYRKNNGSVSIYGQNESGKVSAEPTAADLWCNERALVPVNGVEDLRVGLLSTRTADAELISGYDNFTLKDVTYNRTPTELNTLLDRMCAAADKLLAGDLAAVNRNELTNAKDDVVKRAAGVDKDTLYALYLKLRTAIENAKNGTSGVAGIEAETADAPVYDLSGRKVADSVNGAKLAKGIYISGGKKILVK